MRIAGLILGILVAVHGTACEGSDHPVGSADEADAGGNSGGSAGAAGNPDWGDLPIPEGCMRASSDTTDEECQLEADCAWGEWVTSHCLMEQDGEGPFIGCTCIGTGDDIWYRMDETVPLADACAQTLALCFQWPELDADPYECAFPTDDAGANSCSSEITCEREGTLGEQEFTESHLRVVECSSMDSGFSCSCTWPILRRFEGTTEMPACTDARDWCAGVGVDPTSSPTCTTTLRPPEEGDDPAETCTVDVACERAVTVAGQELTMYDDTWVACNRTATSGVYRCQCLEDPDSTEVPAPDAENACRLAASRCEPRR